LLHPQPISESLQLHLQMMPQFFPFLSTFTHSPLGLLSSVLVHLGCYYTLTYIAWLTYNRHFSQFCRLEILRPKLRQRWCLVRTGFWFIDDAFSLCPHTEQGKMGFPQVSFIRH
jgi:hypothetical protein